MLIICDLAALTLLPTWFLIIDYAVVISLKALKPNFDTD
jgi:hypothetical protein